MGKWSRLAGEAFLHWMAPAPGLRWVDVGCGNGAFTELIIERCQRTFASVNDSWSTILGGPSVSTALSAMTPADLADRTACPWRGAEHPVVRGILEAMAVRIHGADGDPLRGLSDSQRAAAVHSESIWRRAHAIASAHPEVDPGDLYHALRCLELEPAERLRRGLSRGRLRAHGR